MSRNAANQNRIMKWVDYTHSTPRIFLPKPYVTALAKAIRRTSNSKHRECVTVVGNCFCGIEKCFNEYYELHRFDLDFHEALKEHPDIVLDCATNLSKRSGLSVKHILAVLALPIRYHKKSSKPYIDWKNAIDIEYR